jgi:hypothetical protein
LPRTFEEGKTAGVRALTELVLSGRALVHRPWQRDRNVGEHAQSLLRQSLQLRSSGRSGLSVKEPRHAWSWSQFGTGSGRGIKNIHKTDPLAGSTQSNESFHAGKGKSIDKCLNFTVQRSSSGAPLLTTPWFNCFSLN